MRLIFLDDSEQTDPPRRGLHRLRAFGAAIVPGDQVAGYATDLAALRVELGIPDDAEIKWKPPKNSALSSDPDRLRTLRLRMLEAAIARQVSTVVVIVDHGAAYKDLSAAELGREKLLPWMYERLSYHLDDRKDIGIVIADKPGGGQKEDARWLADTLRLTKDGTEYVKSDRIVLPILTAASHHVPHLQLADLVVAATTAAVAGRKSGLDLGPALAKLMHRNVFGDAGGAGVVIWPARHNLMFWCFGERSYSRPGMMAGVGLPAPGLPYHSEDGLPESALGEH